MANDCISVDCKDFKKLVNNLHTASRGAYPLAVRSTLNRMAFEASKKIKNDVLPRQFTLRNAYIKKTIQYQRCANTFKIDQMSAQAGQVSRFAGKPTEQLKKQEYGQSVKARGKYTKAATPMARSGSFSKKVATSKLISNLQIVNLKNVVNNATKNKAMQLKQACAVRKRGKVLSGKNFNVIATNSKGKRGIWSIQSGKKSVLLYAFKHKVTHIKRTRWLEPTAKVISYRAEEFFIKEGAVRLQKALSKGLRG